MDSPDTMQHLLSYQPSRRAQWVLGAMVCLLYVAAITPCWWPTPDSALYLGLARSLARGEGYLFNGQPNTTVTPGFPLLLAGIRLTLGPDPLYYNALVILCGLGMLGLAWQVTRRLAGPTAGMIVLLATALSYPVYHTSQRVLTDAPFALCGWIALATALHTCRLGKWRWLIAVALASAAGVLIRAPGLIFLAMLAVGILLHREGTLSLRGRFIVAGAIVLPALLTGGTLYLLTKLGGDPSEAPMYVSRTAQNVFNPSRMLWQLLEGLAMLPRALSRLYSGQEFPPLGLLLVPMWIWGAYREFRAGRGLLPWLTVAYVLTLALLGAIHSRYFFPIWPAMALLILLGGVDLAARAIKSRGARVTPRRTILAAIIILGTGTAINAPRTLRNALYYNAAAHTGDYYEVIRDGRHLEIFEAAAAIKTLWKPGTTVMTIRDDVRVLHYLTDKRIHPLPGPHEPAPGEQVAAIAEAVATRREPIVVVIDTDDVTPSFREQWARLNGTLRLRKEVQSGRYEIYLRR